MALAERIRSAFAEAAAEVDGHPVGATVSIGLVRQPGSAARRARTARRRPIRRSITPRSAAATASRLPPSTSSCGARTPRRRPWRARSRPRALRSGPETTRPARGATSPLRPEAVELQQTAFPVPRSLFLVRAQFLHRGLGEGMVHHLLDAACRP